MSFLRPAEQSPDTERMFEADSKAMGYLPNYTRLFAHSPAVYAVWQQLNGAVKAGMELRRYELATLAVARALKSSYCGLAHGKVLRDKFSALPERSPIPSTTRASTRICGRR